MEMSKKDREALLMRMRKKDRNLNELMESVEDFYQGMEDNLREYRATGPSQKDWEEALRFARNKLEESRAKTTAILEAYLEKLRKPK